jgi:hypothetical protein
MPNTTSTSYVPPRINHTVTETTLFWKPIGTATST